MSYVMFVSTVLYCGDIVSLGGKYAVLPMCILIGCCSVC